MIFRLLALSTLLLAGCAKHITPAAVADAEELCAMNDGLRYIRITSSYWQPHEVDSLHLYGQVHCNNHAMFEVSYKGD